VRQSVEELIERGDEDFAQLAAEGIVEFWTCEKCGEQFYNELSSDARELAPS
jgi:uncharacterized protein (DUF2164 family)